MRILLKSIGIIFLMWLGMVLWYALAPMFLPGPTVGPSSWQAMPDGRLVRPFDNAEVILYTMPLFLVWLLCAIAQARRLSPLAVVGALALLWLAAFAVWNYVVLTLALLAPLVLLALCTKGFSLASLFVTPRRLDRLLSGLRNGADGWLARRHGPGTARAGHAAAVLVIAGAASWALWHACDGLDGHGIPGTFGLAARSGAVAFGAFLLLRGHLRIARSPHAGSGDFGVP